MKGKLTYQLAEIIRSAHNTGDHSVVQLGAAFGVSHQTISKIINFQVYKRPVNEWKTRSK